MRRTTVASVMLFATLAIGVSCSRMRSDEAISTDIKAGLFSDPALKSTNISVAVRDGVVTLSGEASDEAARLAAERIAKETKGVRRVDDQIVAAASRPAAPTFAESEPARFAPVRKHSAAKSHTVTPAPETRPVAPAPVETARNVPEPAPAPAPIAPPPPQPRTVTVPATTVLSIRTIDPIDSRTNQAGEVFRASLDAPIVVDNEVIAPAGSDAFIKLTNAKSEGRYTGRNELTLELASVVAHGKTYNVVSSDVRQSGSSRGKNSAAKIGGGAAIGAVIGAIAGGGKGAAIGAAIGGAGGAGLQGLRKGKDLKIPPETKLDFTLQQPFDVTYVPGRASSARADRPPSAQ